MKLYTDNEGNWRGTQAQARTDLNMWTTEEVPTSKDLLLYFLNQHQVGMVVDTVGKPYHKTTMEDLKVEHIKDALHYIVKSRAHLSYALAKMDKDTYNAEILRLEKHDVQ